MELKRIKRDLWYRTSAGIGQCLEVGGTFPPSIRMRIMQPVPRGVISVAPRDVLEEVSAPEKTLAAAAATVKHVIRNPESGLVEKVVESTPLSWTFDGAGEWEAESQYTNDGINSLVWKIGVCDDGTFDVSESDLVRERFPHKPDCLATLALAKAWCSREEARLLSEPGE